MDAAAVHIVEFQCGRMRANGRLLLSEDKTEPASEAAWVSDALQEDRRYWYELVVDDDSVEATVLSDGLVVRPRPRRDREGVIDTRSHAGILTLRVRFVRGDLEETVAKHVDVLPAKFDLPVFRTMVEEIAARCLDLALRFGSPVSVPLHAMDSADASGMQQRFYFLEYLLGNETFHLALSRITEAPHRRIESDPLHAKLAQGRRLGRAAMRALASSGNRVPVPDDHPLKKLGSLPRAAVLSQRIDTLDTSENRFVKFVLEQFCEHLTTVQAVCHAHDSPLMLRIGEKANALHGALARILQQSMFADVGSSSFMPFGSPVLQRRTGYRELLQAWLRFHVAASLRWDGGEDVFGAGKRDTDKLYEYWLFFQFLGVLHSRLGVAPPSAENILMRSDDGLIFRLKAGRNFNHEGIVDLGFGRPLRVRFSYNRTFGADARPDADGSWSFAMRPDFTVTFWPASMDAATAERLHVAVHLHFDSKYRLESATGLFEAAEAELAQLKNEEQKGRYKRADVLIAHAYRDSIRRSGGAYILYPGKPEELTTRRMYHEVLPGIGAYPVRPAPETGRTGMESVGDLLVDVVNHLCNRGSAREWMEYSAWVANRSAGVDQPTRLLANMPELDNGTRVPPPFQNVLLQDREPSFSIEWMYENALFPINVSQPGAASALQADAVVLHRSNDTLALIPIDKSKITFANASEIGGAVGTVANGVYALLPLQPRYAATLKLRTPDSLRRALEAAANLNVACMPWRLLTLFLEPIL